MNYVQYELTRACYDNQCIRCFEFILNCRYSKAEIYKAVMIAAACVRSIHEMGELLDEHRGRVKA